MIVLCDVESLARRLRDSDLDLEEAPAKLAATQGPSTAVRRVYAAGNRFARLRRILEDAGYERIEVAGTPESIHLQLTLDAVDLCHCDPGARFLLVAEPDDLQPLLERLASYGREVAFFDPTSAAAPATTDGDEDQDEDEDEDERDEHRSPQRRVARRQAERRPFDDEDEVAGDEVGDDEPDDDVELEELAGDFDDEVEEADEVDVADEVDEDTELDRVAGDDRDDGDHRRRSASGDRRRTSPSSDRPERGRGGSVAVAVRASGGPLRPHDRDDPFDLLLGAIERIVQGPPRLVFESVVRQEILEMEPRFNERTAGFGSFTELFEEARERGLIELRREPATGTYVVTAARLRLD